MFSQSEKKCKHLDENDKLTGLDSHLFVKDVLKFIYILIFDISTILFSFKKKIHKNTEKLLAINGFHSLPFFYSVYFYMIVILKIQNIFYR